LDVAFGSFTYCSQNPKTPTKFLLNFLLKNER